MISLVSEQTKRETKWNGTEWCWQCVVVAREITMAKDPVRLGYSPFRTPGYHFGAAAYLSYDHLPNLIRELLIFSQFIATLPWSVRVFYLKLLSVWWKAESLSPCFVPWSTSELLAKAWIFIMDHIRLGLCLLMICISIPCWSRRHHSLSPQVSGFIHLESQRHLISDHQIYLLSSSHQQKN